MKKPLSQDPLAAHVALGRPNEEVIEESERIRREREEQGYPKVEFGADATDKDLFDRRLDDDFDPYSEKDPVSAAVDAHREPGMSYKLLSDKVCNILGTRGYEIVKDKNGEPVKIGNMPLGKIPTRIAERRQRRYQEDAESDLKSIQDGYDEKLDRLQTEARAMGMRVMKPSEVITDTATGESRAAGTSIQRGTI